MIVKTIAFADIFTLRNYYTNTLLFNFFVFFGSVALYRIFSNISPVKKWILIVFIFLFPSSMFYTTAIHRDGLILLSTGIIMYAMYQMLHNGFTLRRFCILILFFLLVFSIRNFVSIVMLPALIAWWISHNRPQYAKVIFASVLLFCALVFFTTKNFIPSADFPAFVSERRAAFESISLTSNTYLPLGPLVPTFAGFMHAAPVSIYHAFFLPALWNFPNLMSFPFVAELIFIWLLFLLSVIYPGRKRYAQCCLFIGFFCLVNILMIGYTIPNLGAILRYRSIYLHLLSICFLVSINWRKAGQIPGRHETSPSGPL